MQPRARDPLVLLLVVASLLAIAIVCLGTAPTADAATIVVPDDYGTIQEAIDNATSGDTIRIYDGTYIEAVTVGLDVDIVGNGTTQTIIQSAVAATVTINFDGVTISDVQVKGGTTAGIFLAAADCVVERVDCTGNVRGLGLYGADGNLIGNSTFTGNSYAGIGVYSGSDSNRFFNVSCDGNGNFGLDVFSGSSYNTFETCSFDQCTGTGVLINGGADHNTIANSSMDGNGNYGLSIATASYTTVRDSTISQNTNNNGANIGMGVSDNLLTRLVVDGNGIDGIYIDDDSNSTYTDLTITNNVNNGFSVQGSSMIDITHCLLRGNMFYAIYTFQCSQLRYLDNEVRNNFFGIYVDSCSDSEVGLNTVSDQDGHGIGLQNSGGAVGVRVHNNTIERNALVLKGFEAGIDLGGPSVGDNNIIEDNSLMGNNKGIVILFVNAKDNIIRGNTIQDSKVYGIENAFTPGPNTFYHNNFINNPTQVRTPNANDAFDNGYPFGGNYWDTYAGNDLLNGPNQNMWGPDGFGDTPMTVSGAVVDNYPLMNVAGDPSDSIRIVHPVDGAWVSGTLVAEAVVVSSPVSEVVFFLDGTMVGRDPAPPYQLILDTTALTEDAELTLSAEARRITGPPIQDEVRITVNNRVASGSYIGVATVMASYGPDDGVTAMVTLLSPPAFDHIVLRTRFQDPSGNWTSAPSLEMDASGGYGFTLRLPSDIGLGSVVLEVAADAYMNGSMVWTSVGSTVFSVSGLSFHQEFASMLAALDTVLGDLQGLNATTQAQMAIALATTLAAIDGMSGSIGTVLAAMWSDYNTTEDADLASIVDTISDMWTGINSSAQQGFTAVLAGLGMTEDNVTAELMTLQAALAGDIQLSQQQLRASLDALWGGLNTSFADLDGAIQARLDQLETTMADDGNALIEYIDLKIVQVELYMDMINASLQLRLDAIEAAVAAFQADAAEELMTIQDFLGGLEENETAHYAALAGAVAETGRLLEDLNSTTLADLHAGLLDLQQELEGLNTTEGNRHAQTVDALLLELDVLSGQVSDGFNDTDTQLLALDKLDTILLELDSVSADVSDTKEATSGGDEGIMVLLFLLVVLAIANLGFMFIGLQKLRGMRTPPPEPPMEELEPVAPVEPPVTVEEEEEPTPDRYGLAMEEPIMYPPVEPEMFSGQAEPAPEPPVPEPPAPEPVPSPPVGKYERHEAIWAEEILVEEGVSTVDEGPGAEATEAEILEEQVPEPEPSGEAAETPEEPATSEETPDLGEVPADEEPVEGGTEEEPEEGEGSVSDWELEDITDEM